MSVTDGPAQPPGHSPVSTRLLVCLVVVFIAAGFGTLLLTGQSHHAEAKIMCERFVKRRLTSENIHFSGETVRDLSATEHVVTGTARAAGLPPKSYTCTVSHAGSSWVLAGLTGV
ncbi:MAG TPA: hypothetical protein VGD53_19230 [Actinoallomurus sp.]|jgi:hypothetical protein